MDEHAARRIEEAEKELHLAKHRLAALEQEQLPRRVASMEPIVQRLEHKLDDLGDRFDEAFSELKASIGEQKALQKGVIVAVVGITGLIQLLPYLKGFIQ